MKTYNETELRQIAEQMLYDFTLNLNNKLDYTIDNFIEFFTIDKFTGGKNEVEFDIFYGSFVKKTKLLAIVGDRPIVISPEFIFYNYSPENHIKRCGYFDYFRLPHKYNDLGPGQVTKSHRNYPRDRDHWTGLGKEIVYYDKILDGYNYAKDNGYRVLHQGRSTHKERSEKNKQISSGWKYSTKRKRQYK